MTSRPLPEPLQRGDTIGLISTAAPTAARCPRRFTRAVGELERLGYATRTGAGVLRPPRTAWAGGSARERVDDLHALVEDDSVTAILATVGGLTTSAMLELVDWGLLAARPKLLIGYSDLTTLQAALWTRTGVGAIYGPSLLPQFGEPGGVDPFTLAALERVVGQAAAAGPLPQPETALVGRQRWDRDDDAPRARASAPQPRMLRPGRAEGPLVPANLDGLLMLAGTSWFPPLEGTILALEATNGTPAGRVHAGLTQLRQLGAFGRAAGLVLGRLAPAGLVDDAALDAIVRETVDGAMPIVADLAFGHTDPMVTLPWGVRCELVADPPSLTLLEAAVAPARRAA